MFKCKHCSYTADKPSSLNRHMRIHRHEDKTASLSIPFVGGGNLPQAKPRMKSPGADTFCKECRIQFSSMHTYWCHKEHYCAQRRKKLPLNVPVIADTTAYAIFPPGVIFPQTSSNIAFPGMSAIMRGNDRMSLSDSDSTASETPTSLILPNHPIVNKVRNSAAIATIASSSRKTVDTSEDVKRKEDGTYHPHPVKDLQVEVSTPRSNSTDNNHSPKDLDELPDMRDGVRRNLTEKEPKHKENVEYPLDLTVSRKPISPKEQRTSTHDQKDPHGSSAATSVDGAWRIKREPDSSPLSMEDTNSKQLKILHGNVHEEKQSSTLTPRSSPSLPLALGENMGANSIPIQMLPHPSVLVSPIAFLSPPLLSNRNNLPSPSEKRPLSQAGISKCNDCNIVFYKHENYLVHRQYYCSGNRLTASSTQGGSSSKPSNEIPRQNMPLLVVKNDGQSPPVRNNDQENCKNIRDTQPEKVSSPLPEIKEDITATEVKYKYFCVPCRIKFSNANILSAHKEYYCPAGKDSEQSIVASNSQSCLSSSPCRSESPEINHAQQHQTFTCTKCKNMFTSARLLRLHLCDGGFPCPHCDHVAVTENRLAEHLKAHAPTRAFRCTICGYRGNTARGMRMHGKSHIDEGLDFTDENMLEYHEPALMPVIPNPTTGHNTESELLRIKNEPYKRRRSRKAYEKFDYPQAKVDVPQMCPLCGQSFSNTDSLASHFKVHEIAATQYMAGFMKCIHCDYVGSSPEDLRSHFEFNHIRQLRKRPRSPNSDSDEGVFYQNQYRNPISSGSYVEEDEDVHGDIKFPRRESPHQRDMESSHSKNIHSERKSNVANGEVFDKESSHYANPLIPTTVTEGENTQHPEKREETTIANFLHVDDIKTERISPSIETCQDQTSLNSTAKNHSPTLIEDIPVQRSHTDVNDGSPYSPNARNSHSRNSSPKENGICGDNFLNVNIKTEPVDMPQSPTAKQTDDNAMDRSSRSRSRSPEDCPSQDRDGRQEHIQPFLASARSPSSRHIDVDQKRTEFMEQASGSDKKICIVSPENQSGPSRMFSIPPPATSYFHRPGMPCFFLPSTEIAPIVSESYRKAPTMTSNDGKCYCHDCNISFSREATYLAHKKHYCRGSSGVRTEKQTFVRA